MDKKSQIRINKNNRMRGGKFEKTVADFLGFDVVPYSGSNARFGYGDVRNEDWLIECKNITADNGKITIKLSWIEKNRERADNINKSSCIAWMPAGRPDKFILMERKDYIQFNIKPDMASQLIPKAHNTKNLIFHMSDLYIKNIRQGSIVEFTTNHGSYFMMSLQKFKELIQ